MKERKPMAIAGKPVCRPGRGVTLLELIVVVLIIGILSTVAVSVYTGQVERARVAAARDIISQIESAVARYEIDTGQYPPSGYGTTLPPSPLTYVLGTNGESLGSGYLQVALVHSLSGNVYLPLDRKWLGPYLEPNENQLGDINGVLVSQASGLTKPEIQLLDPWGLPYYYIRHNDYATMHGTELLAGNPYRGSETYYNPSTVQIFSMGPNGRTYDVPYRGLETDDVNNW
jgi:prepilin-type N-terminal cleavage/methylation domain-containing protein